LRVTRNRKLAFIAGNGNFPLLVPSTARPGAGAGKVVVAAIKEETWQEVGAARIGAIR